MKKIGILGLGVVGKSVLEFYKNKNFQIDIWDEKDTTSQISILDFLKSNDLNIISPGIPYKKYESFYKKYPEKCSGELDIFQNSFFGKSIVVTGSLGKTTIAKLISFLLEKNNYKVGLAGNIGLPMMDLIKNQTNLDLSVLELSSFQLYLNKKFAPDVAIWSNFYLNHLDWHQTESHYFDSKFNIFKYQKDGQFSLMPIELLNEKNIDSFNNLDSSLCFICNENFSADKYLLSKKKFSVFYVDDEMLKLVQIDNLKIIENKTIFDLRRLPKFSFIQNWVFALAAVYVYGVDLKKLKIDSNDIDLKDRTFEHRLEFFVTINGIDFYNDSKSTVIQATDSALKELDKNGKPIILVLGGLSKGVDRSVFIKLLPEKYKNLKELFFFGQESNLFENLKTYPTLDSVLKEIQKIAKSGDQILFSPAGSSFDLFDNYMHRGKVFKDLVLKMYNQV
ncbi:MAG: UDP-N-acetylmuramoyl-L-alanine--D-glutamate ligase [bacterium]